MKDRLIKDRTSRHTRRDTAKRRHPPTRNAVHERSRAHKAEIASRVSRTYSTLHLLQAADEREYMLLLSVPSSTCFTATSHGSSVGIGQRRVMIHMQAVRPFHICVVRRLTSLQV